MSTETCEYHALLVADIAVIKTDISYIRDRFSTHIEEADKPGGFRDKMLILEREVSELKKRFWASALIGGIIGALIGSGSTDVLVMFIKWIMTKGG